MKTFAILCFLFLASACIFAVKAEEENSNIEAPKIDDQPEAAVDADEKAPEESDEATEEDEETEQEESDEEESDEEENDEEEEEESEDEEEEVEDEDEEKRSLYKCRRSRKKGLWCIACGCRRIACRIKFCARRICRPRRVCGKRPVCRIVKKSRIAKRPIKVKVGYQYVTKYVTFWKYYTVKVCKNVVVYCPRKCIIKRKKCGRICKIRCGLKKCRKHPYHG